jgi:hypothetical protein
MIPTYPWAQFPQQTTTITPNGQASRYFWSFLQALFKRTGGDSGIQDTVADAVSAAGATQATATTLSNDYNAVTAGAGGVLLSNLQPAQRQVVYNGSGGNLNVYPFTGGEIDAIGSGGPYVLANGKTQVFTCYKTLTNGFPFYRSLQLG